MKRFTWLLLAFALVAAPAHSANLKWAAQNDILTLDPHSQNHATTNSILQHTYEGLTRYTRDYKVEPCLATDWKQLSDTDLAAVTTYTKNTWSNKTGQLVQPSEVLAQRGK